MYVEMDWHPTTKEFDFTVTSYGEEYVAFQSDDTKDFRKHEVLKRVFIDKASSGKFNS